MSRFTDLVQLFREVETVEEAQFLVEWYKKAKDNSNFQSYVNQLKGTDKAITDGIFLYLRLVYHADSLVDRILTASKMNSLVKLGAKQVVKPYIVNQKSLLLGGNIDDIFVYCDEINQMNTLADVLAIEHTADIKALHPETKMVAKAIVDSFSGFTKFNLTPYYDKFI